MRNGIFIRKSVLCEIFKSFLEIALDNGIINTMTNKILSAQTLLNGTRISVLDAARLIRNALDAKPANSKFTNLQFCSNIIEAGKRNIRQAEMAVKNGFLLYLETKSHLRAESLRDIRYLGNRLLNSNPEFAKCNFSELSLSDCEKWISEIFNTPSQFNKARTMLHGLFEFALRRQWCDKNIVKLIERKRVVEKEIKPLALSQAKQLIKTSQSPKYKDCSAAVGLLAFAGILPNEVRRLKWNDIDLEENAITIRSECSKTGGVRHVEIYPSLKALLQDSEKEKDKNICPINWTRRWRKIRDDSGFKGQWTQDILRHTYASYHAKYFRDLPRLQLNMGHRDQHILRSRYINMSDILHNDARKYFEAL